MSKFIFVFLFSFVSLIALFFYQNARFNDGKLHIVFCDVGQGDGIFIRTSKGQNIVIDGGPDNSILSCLSNNMPFWDKKIELIILTHPHEDHFNGLIAIAQQYKVTSFSYSKTEKDSQAYKILANALSDGNTTQRPICQGDSFKTADGVTLKTLWPQDCKDALYKDSDLNAISVIQLLSYKDFQVLFTGDANATIQSEISNRSKDVEVLKVPHHGSRTGLDNLFLNAVHPKLAVISVGKKNRYGHPASNILKLLDERKIKTYRTDQSGNVEVVTDGKTYWITQ